MQFTNFPKMGLMTCPTPLQEMPRLQAALEAKPRIFFKRDDLSGMGLGGNKNRKLEYVVRKAVDSGCDTLITTGGLQSNHCRQTLAYAKRLGLDCHLVLSAAKPQPPYHGNVLVFEIMGAEMHFEPDGARCAGVCEQVAEGLRAAGKKPFIIPLGASTSLGALGYVESLHEIGEQEKDFGVRIKHVLVASGSGGTHAGAEVGARLYLHSSEVHGIAISRSAAEQKTLVGSLARDTARLLKLSMMMITDQELTVHDGFLGEGYAIPTVGGLEAIRLVAKTEGILLDPVYTGKAMHGMISLLQSGQLDKAEAVVFLHTGGSPANDAFSQYF